MYNIVRELGELWALIVAAYLSLRATMNVVEGVWLLSGAFCLAIDVWMLKDLYADRHRLHNDEMNGGDNILIVTYIGMN